MNKQELTKQFAESSERAFRLGIKKKLDAMVKDESVLRATAELLLADAEILTQTITPKHLTRLSIFMSLK